MAVAPPRGALDVSGSFHHDLDVALLMATDWQDAADWQRVSTFVKRRRQQRGKQTAMTTSPATWTKIENAKAPRYKDWMLARVEDDLDWPSGTIQRVAEGGLPPEGDVSLDERVMTLEGQMAELLELVRRLGTTRGGPA